MTVYFYNQRHDYGCFSNFSKHEVELDGHIWPTSEHYYQAQKFLDELIKEKIRLLPYPGAAAKMGRDRLLPLRSDWEEVKDGVMRRVIMAKFQQHLNIKDILLSTGNDYIIEKSPVDHYWGCGQDGSGKNMLGRILMEVRNTLMFTK